MNKLPTWEETLARLQRASKLRRKVESITRGRKRATDAQRKRLLKVLLNGLIEAMEREKENTDVR